MRGLLLCAGVLFPALAYGADPPGPLPAEDFRHYVDVLNQSDPETVNSGASNAEARARQSPDPRESELRLLVVPVDGQGFPVLLFRLGCIPCRFVPEPQRAVGGRITRAKLHGLLQLHASLLRSSHFA